MALITRFNRLFRADIHAVLDRVEEPDILLRQAIREMEEDIAGDEQRIKVLQYEHGQIGIRRTEIEQSLHAIEEELDVCFNSREEDLARTVIRRKLQAEQLDRALLRKRKSLEDSLSELNTRIGENRQRLMVMQQKSALLAENETNPHCEQPWSLIPAVISDQDVEVAYLREKQQRGQP